MGECTFALVAVFPKRVNDEQLSAIKEHFKGVFSISEDDLEHLILIRGIILAYSAEVNHLATWAPLAEALKEKFGAKEVLIASEEDGDGDIVNHLILEFEAKELAKKYRKLHRQVASIKEDLQTLYNSCIEGQTGDWDCSTDEGREGFIAMAERVKKIAKTLNLRIKEQE